MKNFICVHYDALTLIINITKNKLCFYMTIIYRTWKEINWFANACFNEFSFIINLYKIIESLRILSFCSNHKIMNIIANILNLIIKKAEIIFPIDIIFDFFHFSEWFVVIIYNYALLVENLHQLQFFNIWELLHNSHQHLEYFLAYSYIAIGTSLEMVILKYSITSL